MQWARRMKTPKNALFWLFSLLTAGLSTLVSAYDQPCWEPYTSDAPDGALCWFDPSSMGLNWQVGVVATVTKSGAKERICMNIDRSSGVELNYHKYHWLLLGEPKESVKTLPFGKPVYQFVGNIEFCPGTRERNISRLPAIPEDKQATSLDDDLICRKLSHDSLVIGIDVKDKGCQDTLDVKYSFTPKAGQQNKPGKQNEPKPSGSYWVDLPESGWAFYYVTHENGYREKIETHFKCKKHCRAHAKKEAESKHHRYMSYDGTNYHTGTHVNLANKDHGRNMVFENLAEEGY